jgi:MFS family permease
VLDLFATQGADPLRAGMVVAMALGASMLWSPVFGIIADRVNRLTLLCVGFLLAAGGPAPST